MGGCATKPKVSKGDEGEIPAPSPPKEEVPEAEKAAEGENKVEAAKDRDVTDDNIDDDQSNKRPSLSNLFEEKEHKGTAESDNTQSEAEPMEKETLESVPQESPETVKQELVPPPVTKNQETKEPEKLAEPASLPPGNAESVQSNQAEPAPEAATTVAVVGVPETQNRETPAGERKDETLVGN
ncbi:hypothetical protein V6N13_111217 [Hibiscus sabdariffa]|uniref:Uncharacterized protein n=1 Tax=Hibiscus sabdariffa TaxID=183260 RepID=A0ABR2TJK1_9ROSI